MTDVTDREIATPDLADPVRGHYLAKWTVEARELVKLAGPLVVTQLMQMAILTTDVIMLGRLGKEAVAAAALGNTVFYFTWLTGMGPAAAVSPMIAQILGAHPCDRAKVRAVTRMGFWAVWLLWIPLAGVLLATESILLAFGQSPPLAHLASVFTLPLCLGLFFNMSFQVLRNYSTALGAPNPSLIVMTATVCFNALADYALIFGHFGFPRLEVIGSGIATTTSFGFSLITMLAVIRFTPKLKQYRAFRRFDRPDWPKFTELIRLGMPIGLTMIFEAMLFNCSMLVMGTFGTDFVAAHQIALNVPSITFMVPLGIAMAATVRVGSFAGAGDIDGARRAGYTAMLIGTVFMAFCGIVMALLPREIALLYFGANTADAKLVSLTVTFLYVAAAFQVFDALQVVAAFALRGLKDARVPMLLAGASYWLVGAPTSLVLAFWFDMQGLGIWIGLAGALGAAASLMSLRFWHLTRCNSRRIATESFRVVKLGR
jgi:MATE family multidrug resistance protein